MAARRALPPHGVEGRPRAQFVFCIDEREESIRRALEEQDPAYITYGAAGFFGVAIDYQGLYDHEPAAHCPVVVTPAHEVHEQPVYTDLGWHHLRQPSARPLARAGATGRGRVAHAQPAAPACRSCSARCRRCKTLTHLVAPRSKPLRSTNA